MAWAILPIALLGACTGSGPERAFLGAGWPNPAGTNHLIRFAQEPLRSDDLATLICPEQFAVAATVGAADAPRPDASVGALACFHKNATADAETAKRLRNDVQHILILRSGQNCSLWKTYLQRGGAINRGTLNVLSVLAGGAGAVVEGQAASILAAVSGAAAGSGAAIDAAMLHGLTEGPIIPKVGEVRELLRHQIEGHQRDDLVTYSLVRALSDAVRYHAACNISAALSVNAPAAEFGNQMRTQTAVINGVRRATVTVAGVSSVSETPPTADDVRRGATFLTTDGDVVTVSAAPTAAGTKGVDYAMVATGKVTNVAGEAIGEFVARINGTVLVKASK